MFAKMLLLFIIVPIVELVLLVKVGSVIGGVFPTLLVIFITGTLGATLARREGLMVWQKIQGALRAGQMPATELVDGLLILIAGIVLLTPGFLTDFCGFMLLIPMVRGVFRVILINKFKHSVKINVSSAVGRNSFFANDETENDKEFGDEVIDVKAEVVDE